VVVKGEYVSRVMAYGVLARTRVGDRVSSGYLGDLGPYDPL